MSINRKSALNSATAVNCIGQYAGLRRMRLGFDAALGFNFMHFLMTISGWGRVVTGGNKINQKFSVKPFQNMLVGLVSAWTTH